MPEAAPGPAEFRATVGRLVASMEALAALAVLLGERAGGTAPDPALDGRLLAVAEALGVRDVLDEIDADTARGLRALARSTLAQAIDFVDDPDGASGWTYEEPELLQATGSLSAAFARVIHDDVVPVLPGLAERLGASDAAFLDVGVGVAALTLAMARLFPTLHVTGIDIWEPALQLARANTEDAHLTDRVVVREQDVTRLDDQSAYDLIWFAVPFLPEAIVPDALERCARALRPGGWLLFARFGGFDALSLQLADIRTIRAGGAPWTDDEALALLTDAGLRDAMHVATPGAPGRLTAARR